MSLFQVAKPKSVGKVMVPFGGSLQSIVLSTLSHMADMVGITMGPGGRQVLIERPEIGFKPLVTKDGVTVVKHLGYQDPVRQLILESARDAALRTASEAGDGTTTATVLSAAIARSVSDRVKEAAGAVSPQLVVRQLEGLIPEVREVISENRLSVTGKNYQKVLKRVASLSANGDESLAEAVMEALDLVGEEGNMTIVEATGESRNVVDKLSGYTIESGYEESCKNLGASFINDRSGTMVTLDNPLLILFNGRIDSINQIINELNRIHTYMEHVSRHDRGVVIVANRFSDEFIGDLQLNWNDGKSTLKVFPVLTQKSIILNSESQFLADLSAYTGVPVYDPVNHPLSEMDPKILDEGGRVQRIECQRFRTAVIATEDDLALQLRVEELKEQKEKAESEYEQRELELRIGKLTSGIARLTIYGPTAAETREKRDRAEDAWCAIRGAAKYGAVPGGGWTLLRISTRIAKGVDTSATTSERIGRLALVEALLEPVKRIYRNWGFTEEALVEQLKKLASNEEETFDIQNLQWVPKFDLLDSAQAVSEAILNSISIAALLGTLGGVVSYYRDGGADTKEREYTREFEEAIK